MGRAPCCSKVGLNRGPWTSKEDKLLTEHIKVHGEGHWRSLPKKAGLLRCGKSCRLRWMNYLRPDIKRGNIGVDEEDLIIRLHSLLGNRWSLIAGRLPGRTDNEIKNYWNTHLSKKFKNQGQDPNTHKSKSKSKSTQEKKKKNGAIKEKTEIKIHLPKPIKVTSFPILKNKISCFHAKNESSSHCRDKEENEDTENLDLPWCDIKSGGDDIFINDRDFDNGCDHGFQSHIPTKENMLKELYEEYLQLLKTEEDKVLLDSFAESLWV